MWVCFSPKEKKILINDTIHHPSDMMINDMIHLHGDLMEIKPLILLIRWQRGGDGGERDRRGLTKGNVKREEVGHRSKQNEGEIKTEWNDDCRICDRRKNEIEIMEHKEAED